MVSAAYGASVQRVRGRDFCRLTPVSDGRLPRSRRFPRARRVTLGIRAALSRIHRFEGACGRPTCSRRDRDRISTPLVVSLDA